MLWGRPPGTKQICFSDTHRGEDCLPCFQGCRRLPELSLQGSLRQKLWGAAASGVNGPSGPKQHLDPILMGFGLMGDAFIKRLFFN